MLYLVPTPIGNLEDMTFRAISVLKDVDLILAEDTRTSAVLLRHYGIETTMKPFHSHNEHKVLAQIISHLEEGMNIACISDAGTPGISDPGFLLVRSCKEKNIEVICLPGPTAFVPALVSSGIPCDKFYFEGFLPHKKGRQKRWNYLKDLNTTIILYESTHRILRCLEEIKETFCDNTIVCVSKEISKKHESHFTSNIINCISHFGKGQNSKGEFVIIIDGSK